jgi:hypothetical protein
MIGVSDDHQTRTAADECWPAGGAVLWLAWAVWLGLVYWGRMLPGLRDLRAGLPFWAKAFVYVVMLAACAHLVGRKRETGPLSVLDWAAYATAAASSVVFFTWFRTEDALTRVVLLAVAALALGAVGRFVRARR